MPPDPPEPRHGRVVLASEIDSAVVRGALRAGDAFRLRRGAYLVDGPRSPTPPDPAARRRVELARIEAVARQLAVGTVISHTSAALVWGLPLWSRPDMVHVVQRHVPGRRKDAGVARHRTTLGADEVVVRHGVPVTSLARTVLDCLRTLPARDGLVVADAALRAGADRDDLTRRLTETSGRGVVRARAVVAAADGGAESPGESVTRFELLRHGLPAPRTQLVVPTRLGVFRADMGWEEWRLLVEFDGLVKYGELSGGDPARVLFQEKRRQEAIEEEGWRVLRVTSPDLRRGAELVARVERAVPDRLRPPRVRRGGLR